MNNYYVTAIVDDNMMSFTVSCEKLSQYMIDKWREEIANKEDVKLSRVFITNIIKLDE